MKNTFSLEEVFKLASEIEKNGDAFYSTLAAETTEDKLKKIFKQLSSMEKEHYQRFINLKESFRGSEITALDENTSDTNFIIALAKTAIFKKESKITLDFSNKTESYLFAIQQEKDSIILYKAIEKILKKDEDKNIINDIIKEEQEHLVQLTNIMEGKY